MKILLIDDQAHGIAKTETGYLVPGPMDAYIRRLEEAGHSLEIKDSVVTALQHIENNRIPEDLVVLDGMMDLDLEIDNQIYDKDIAGLALLRRRLRNKAYAYWNVPVLVFTNRSPDDPEIQEFVAGLALVHILGKSKVKPWDLAGKIEPIVRRSARSTR